MRRTIQKSVTKLTNIPNKLVNNPNTRVACKVPTKFSSKRYHRLIELFDNFITKWEKSQTIMDYEGIGITKNQIITIIKYFDEQQRIKAQEKLKQKHVYYLKNESKNPLKKNLTKWLEKLKKNEPQQYPYIIQLANEYNKKHNIPTRY